MSLSSAVEEGLQIVVCTVFFSSANDWPRDSRSRMEVRDEVAVVGLRDDGSEKENSGKGELRWVRKVELKNLLPPWPCEIGSCCPTIVESILCVKGTRAGEGTGVMSPAKEG